MTLPSCLAPAFGQRAVFFSQKATGSSVCNKLDPFTGTGALSSCWTQTTAAGYGTLNRNNSLVVATGTKGIVSYTGASFTTTQSSTLTVNSTLADISGPMVLEQTNGAGYLWILSTQNLLPVNNTGGGLSPITACPVVSNGDVVKLSSTVTAGIPTITCRNITTGLSNAATDTNSCSGVPCSITGVPGALVAGSDKLTNFIGT